MENAIKMFKNDKFGNVRVVIKDGEPWFVLKDICEALNLTNPSMSVKSLDLSERSKFNLGRQGDALIISESGLYTLILRCRDAVTEGSVAHSFKRWVTSEVLPSLRQTGTYSVAPTFNVPQTLPEALRLAADLAEQVDKLVVVNKELTTENDRIQEVCKIVTDQFTEGLTPTQVFKEFNGANCLQANNYLIAIGWQTKKKNSFYASSYARDKYLIQRSETYTKKDGKQGIHYKTYVTVEGARALFKRYMISNTPPRSANVKIKFPMTQKWDGKLNHTPCVHINNKSVTECAVVGVGDIINEQ